MSSKSKPFHFKVNLLIHREEQPQLVTRLFKWALTGGKFIAIIVEIFVICALVYRYKLDADLMGLQKEINQKVPYIKSLHDQETAIRRTHLQLDTIKQQRQQDAHYNAILERISQNTPQVIKLTNLAVERKNFPKTTFSLSGESPSNQELAAFIRALQKEISFTDISLTNINFDEGLTFTVTGSVVVKPEGAV